MSACLLILSPQTFPRAAKDKTRKSTKTPVYNTSSFTRSSRMSRKRIWLVVIAIVIACVIVGCWLMADRAGRRTYQEYVALDRKGPWGLTNPPWDGPDAVVLYRTGHNRVVCFDAFHSKDLHDRLAAKNGQLVPVAFDTFSYFGKVLSYNVHSVDGIILANGYHVLRDDYAATAGVFQQRPGTAGDDDCW